MSYKLFGMANFLIQWFKPKYTFSPAEEEEEEEVAPPQPVLETQTENPVQKEEEEGLWLGLSQLFAAITYRNITITNRNEET